MTLLPILTPTYPTHGQRRAPVITYLLYTWAPAPTIIPLATPPSSSRLSGIVITHASRPALLLNQSSMIGPFSNQERPFLHSTPYTVRPH